VRKPIVHLFCLPVGLLGRRSDRAMQAVRGGGAPVRSDARSGWPVYSGPWLLDVEAGRGRRWGRRGLVPPSAREWQPQACLEPQGVYFPPGFWELPGTIVDPRIAAALPELRGDVR
jgi:hypothetical protein